tara:strand:- start:562 stop:1059 length:498 start_codon:yes stop_codon:yes gene_type:complete
MKKILNPLIIICVLITTNCGFSPKYSGFKNVNFNLTINGASGDRTLNNSIKSLLKRYQNNNNDRDDTESYAIEFTSTYERSTASRDSKGQATQYNLKASVVFDVSFEGGSKELEFSEVFTINNIENTVEENDYIKIIKGNFAEIFSDKLIINIQKINDTESIRSK